MKDKLTLEQLQKQLRAIYAEMPTTFFEMQQRDKSAFMISREIEKLQNPNFYEQNKAHWDNWEIRL
jgi:hypothetical protein